MSTWERFADEKDEREFDDEKGGAIVGSEALATRSTLFARVLSLSVLTLTDSYHSVTEALRISSGDMLGTMENDARNPGYSPLP